MKRVALLVLGVVAVSACAFAQEAAVETLAAPANLREGATIIKWKPDFTYDTIKKGTNNLVCYDRSGFPEQAAFSIECTNIANLDREAQNLKAEALGDKAKTARNARCGGKRRKPRETSVRIGVVSRHGHG